MRRGRGRQGDDGTGRAAPIPLEPVDLLAGLAPGIELAADDLLAGVAGAEESEPATVTVGEIGRMLRCGEDTVRRLIRTAGVKPVDGANGTRVRRTDVEVLRAGVVRRTPDKPGE